MTGETVHNLRGDYSRMRPDYTVDQDWAGYSREEHDLWKRLYARQVAEKPELKQVAPNHFVACHLVEGSA